MSDQHADKANNSLREKAYSLSDIILEIVGGFLLGIGAIAKYALDSPNWASVTAIIGGVTLFVGVLVARRRFEAKVDNLNGWMKELAAENATIRAAAQDTTAKVTQILPAVRSIPTSHATLGRAQEIDKNGFHIRSIAQVVATESEINWKPYVEHVEDLFKNERRNKTFNESNICHSITGQLVKDIPSGFDWIGCSHLGPNKNLASGLASFGTDLRLRLEKGDLHAFRLYVLPPEVIRDPAFEAALRVDMANRIAVKVHAASNPENDPPDLTFFCKRAGPEEEQEGRRLLLNHTRDAAADEGDLVSSPVSVALRFEISNHAIMTRMTVINDDKSFEDARDKFETAWNAAALLRPETLTEQLQDIVARAGIQAA